MSGVFKQLVDHHARAAVLAGKETRAVRGAHETSRYRLAKVHRLPGEAVDVWGVRMGLVGVGAIVPVPGVAAGLEPQLIREHKNEIGATHAWEKDLRLSCGGASSPKGLRGPIGKCASSTFRSCPNGESLKGAALRTTFDNVSCVPILAVVAKLVKCVPAHPKLRGRRPAVNSVEAASCGLLFLLPAPMWTPPAAVRPLSRLSRLPALGALDAGCSTDAPPGGRARLPFGLRLDPVGQCGPGVGGE